MHRAEKKLAVIQKKIKHSKSEVNLQQIDILKKLYDGKTKKRRFRTTFKVLLLLFVVVLVIIRYQTSVCLLEIPVDTSKAFRKPEDCAYCEGVFKVDKIKNVTPSELEISYLTPAKPVVVTDGTRDWRAVNTFSFEFFKKLYQGYSIFSCQFFPYKTEFKSLQEALNMSEERAHFEEGEKPWYIGWSNCNDEVGKVLSRYYKRPYFLPDTSENMALNWIFMGGAGFGAHMHVDNVHYPSWQAQIKGRKKWYLMPSPECFYRCNGNIEVVVEQGEIIVVDTNRWYHQTRVLPGEISITIGSEFD